MVRRGWRLVSTRIVYHGVKICQGECERKTKRRVAHPFMNQTRKGGAPEACQHLRGCHPPSDPSNHFLHDFEPMLPHNCQRDEDSTSNYCPGDVQEC
jgi:hypothetical protein